MTIDHATNSAPHAKSKPEFPAGPTEFSTCRLEKVRRSFCDAPRWRLMLNDNVVTLTTAQLRNWDTCCRKIFCATHGSPPFWTKDEHLLWLQGLLAECHEVAA